MALKLLIDIQPNYVIETTGSLGSIGYRRGTNNHIVDFTKGETPKYFLNGYTKSYDSVPPSIKAAITEMAINLGWIVK